MPFRNLPNPRASFSRQRGLSSAIIVALIWNFGSTEIPIPTKFDHDLGEIETAGSVIVSLLRTMHWCGDARDVPAMRKRLRGELQEFVNKAMALADESGK